ncbi:hypothetical protein BGZ82_009479 [Podila clonocystis]|nr:hypothetical protein BGZ82_009479 [Podila clonocystis]
MHSTHRQIMGSLLTAAKRSSSIPIRNNLGPLSFRNNAAPSLIASSSAQHSFLSSSREYSSMSQKFSRWVAQMSTSAAKHHANLQPQTVLPPGKSTAELQVELHSLRQVQEHKELVQQGSWTMIDLHDMLPLEGKPHHLTAGTLRGDRMLNVAPLAFMSKDFTSVTVFFHLGRSLCGHDKVIHGGMIASVLDEVTWMAAIPSMPGKAGYTANLNVNYRKRVSADTFVMIKGEFKQVEGRKGWSKATIYDVEEESVLADGTALFVSPFKPETSK